MDLYDRDNLKAFLVTLFGNQANNWPMSEKMFNLTFELVSESSACSSAMAFVPRPIPYGQTPFKWLAKEVRSKFLKRLKNDKEHYVICLKAAAYRMVGKFQMASQGV